MRTILIDDEDGARGHLQELLAARKEIQVVGEADHPMPAIEMVNRLKPDLVFLDIQMPLLDGFEMLPYLTVQPIIIFCTAHDSYALKAFEVNALDFLLKPVTEQRLDVALARAAHEWEKLELLKMMEPRAEGLRKIICRQGETRHVVWLRDVSIFQKEGRYTSVSTFTGEHFLTELSMDYLERKIVHPDFFRVHRGVIVRKETVTGFEAQTYGSGLLTTHTGEQHTISRARFGAFRAWLEQVDP